MGSHCLKFALRCCCSSCAIISRLSRCITSLSSIDSSIRCRISSCGRSRSSNSSGGNVGR
jgi:hypothetical protein